MRLVPALVAALTLVGLTGTAEAAPKVAVIDIVACMQAHPETKKVEEERESAVKQADKNFEANRQRIDVLERELQQMNAENPARARKERQLALQVATTDFNRKWDYREAETAYIRALESIYKAVCGQVQRYARENAIDLVLIRTDMDQPLNAVDGRDFGLKTRMRMVIHADAKADITDAIVKILEQK
jgi:Skp family chaperone for outer membrane proteins